MIDQQLQQGTDSDNNFRVNTGNSEHAQSFTTTIAGGITSMQMTLKKVGSPTGNIYVQIQTNSSGLPSNISLGQSANVDVSTLSTSYGLITFTFSTPVSVNANTIYHCVLMGSFAVNGSNYVKDATVSGGAYAYAGGHFSYRYNAAWTDGGGDLYFVENVDPRGSIILKMVQ